MADSGNTGIRRILKATVYSWQGLKASYQNEEAFRQELMLAIVMVPLGFYLGEGVVEKLLLVVSVLLLLLVEVMNSAIEAVVDRFGSEIHELSGRAKDMGSAAVFIAIAIVVLTWLLILFG